MYTYVRYQTFAVHRAFVHAYECAYYNSIRVYIPRVQRATANVFIVRRVTAILDLQQQDCFGS